MDNIVTIEQLAKTPEKHGRLLSFCWSAFTTAWMFGTDSLSEMSLERTRQRPLLHVERKPSGGQRTKSVYTADDSLSVRIWLRGRLCASAEGWRLLTAAIWRL